MNNPIRPLTHTFYRRWIPTAFVLFLSYTLWVIATVEANFFNWFLSLLTSPESLQVVLDLSLALLLLWQFIYWDHRARGGSRLSMLPFFLATLVIGIIAPLAFLSARAFWPKLFLNKVPASVDAGNSQGAATR